MPTPLDIIYMALKMLAQTTASGQVAAGLYGGASEAGAPVIPGNDQMLFWATEAQNRLCRLCLPIPDYAAVQAPYADALSLCPYTALDTPSGRQLHQVTDLYCNNLRLQPASSGYLRAANWYPPALSGDPTAWANLNSSISLSAYTTQPWFTAQGYAIPMPLTSLIQELDTYIDDYAQIAMWSYLGWRIAVSNQDNSVLAERAGPCQQQFIEVVREIYTRLVSNDSATSAIFVPEAIDAQVQLMKQAVPRT